MESALPAAGFLYWVGAGTVAYLALRIAYSLFTALQVWGLGHEPGVGPGLGEWAVVTGSTDGIGKSYAEELARHGMKVVLISRSQDKLQQVSSEIREKFKVETRTIAVDFTSEDIYDKIKTSLAGLNIGVLVNNVGMSYEYPEYFLEIPDLDNTIKKLINVNVLSVCKEQNEPPIYFLSRIYTAVAINTHKYFTPENDTTGAARHGGKFWWILGKFAPLRHHHVAVRKSKGVILNISSASGMLPVPLLTIYSATKAFVDFFSQCIHEEYRSKGIFVQSVLPFFVATKLAKIRKATLQIPSSETYVKSALKTVGLKSRTNGYPVHSLMGSVFSILPSWLYFKVVMNVNKSVRARYLKKAKKN